MICSKKKYFFVVMVFLLSFSCKKVEVIAIENNVEDLLLKTWVHYYEEGNTNYRPENYIDFSWSWFRQIYTFKENNVCDYLILADNDAHYFETGTWKLQNNNKQIFIYNDTGEVVRKLKINHISESLLQLD